MIFTRSQAGAKKNIGISAGAPFIFLGIKAWVTPISLPKVPAEKAFLRVYLKRTGRLGFITRLLPAKSKEKNHVFYSAATVPRVSNTVRAF